MQIAPNHVVSIDYTLRNDAGDIVDSSQGNAPLAYLHGHHNIIPGLENALTGRAVGDSFSITIPPAEAYGERDPGMIQSVPRNMFQGVDVIEPGMKFQAQTQGGVQVVTVTAVDGDLIELDANHEMAGQTLHFEVTVTDIRDATEEELSHGHVHGPGGHDH